MVLHLAHSTSAAVAYVTPGSHQSAASCWKDGRLSNRATNEASFGRFGASQDNRKAVFNELTQAGQKDILS